MLTISKNAEAITTNLPWPPTVNTYYRNVNGRTLISKKGRAYRREVGQLVMIDKLGPLPKGEIGMLIEAYPPDKRRRDLDNLVKSVADSLQAAGLYEDDFLIADLRVVRRHTAPSGRVRVTLWPI